MALGSSMDCSAEHEKKLRFRLFFERQKQRKLGSYFIILSIRLFDFHIDGFFHTFLKPFPKFQKSNLI